MSASTSRAASSSATTIVATPLFVACTADEPRSVARDVDAGELGDGVGPGDVCERVLGHHDDVEEAECEGRSGDAGAGDREHGRHGARDEHDLACQLPPRVQRRDVLAQLGARRVELADERDGELPGESHRALHGRASRSPDGAVMFAPRDAEPHHLPAVHVPHRRGRGGVRMGVDRRRGHDEGAKISETL